LGSTLVKQGSEVFVVRVLDQHEDRPTSGLPVIGELLADEPSSIDSASRALNSCDVAIVQHEYGLYGGRDGSDVVRVLHGLNIPAIAILHTVLTKPTSHQKEVLNSVIAAVDAVVVMTDAAAVTVRELHELGSTELRVIPHGAKVSIGHDEMTLGRRPRILTWGLLGPGKGVEWMIDAMARLSDLHPAPEYVVAGSTHPKVLAMQGEAYRESLLRRVASNRVGGSVSFDNSYRNQQSLHELIASADVVVLPYDSLDQATSGVLVDAVAAGRPVVATAFPHAVELLSSGAGITVPQRDSIALASAIRRVLTNSQIADNMASEARRLSAGLSWRMVGVEYQKLTQELIERIGVTV
jgi:glycosyltransferase involved in cell wall biosynthesis